ncbi:hypothetical protein D1007_39381 [Hordeum vulgare]|nr:hypothetical protein D1007_39381 [Hordeum vulgare]
MLVIPPKFRFFKKQWMFTGPPRVVSLSANKWCEFWVHVQYFKGHMVLGHGWEYFSSLHKSIHDDLVVFMLYDLGLKV